MTPRPDTIESSEWPWGWAHLPHPHPGVHEIHLLPTHDVGTHAFDRGCACGPVEVDPGFFSHYAFDRREDYEQGGRKKH